MRRIIFLFICLLFGFVGHSNAYDYTTDKNDLFIMTNDQDYADRYQWVARSMCSRLGKSKALRGILNGMYMDENKSFSWSDDTKNVAKWMVSNANTGCQSGDIKTVIQKLDDFFGNIDTDKLTSGSK